MFTLFKISTLPNLFQICLVVSLSSSVNLFSCDMIEYLHVSKNIRSWLVGYKSSKATIYMEPLRHIEVENLEGNLEV